MNESLSNPKEAGVLGRFISRDPIGHAGGLNLYNYPTNPVRYADPAGLKPKQCPYKDDEKVFPDSIAYVNGTGYWRLGWPPYKGVPGISPYTIPNATGYESATSTDFVQALQTSDIFIYTGHHFGNGQILLDDGYFNINDLLKQANRLPETVLLNACNTTSALPSSGEYPNTTFIGYDGFIDNSPAWSQGIQAASDLRSSDPLGNLKSNKSSGVPTMTTVESSGWGGVPYK